MKLERSELGGKGVDDKKEHQKKNHKQLSEETRGRVGTMGKRRVNNTLRKKMKATPKSGRMTKTKTVRKQEQGRPQTSPQGRKAESKKSK